jgi:4-aminobutyrate aminotransferase / (S)-3-amino-2-methylpropionate transaminase / 5-aminovalerate transaminase
MAVIRKKTEIPGPRAAAILNRKDAAVPRGVAHATRVVVASARGAVVEDVDGNRLIDFTAGIGTVNVGHSNPSVIAAIGEQVDRLIHMCFAVAPYEAYISLAERLARLTPGDFPKKTMFANSGAEAVENAVKIARHATKRSAILCFEDAFHGRTLTALALTSKVQPYKSGMGPFDNTIFRVPYAYCYRCAYHLKYPDCAVACVDAIEAYFTRHVEPQSIAAVIVEPVLGEGGFVVPPREFLTKLGALCRRYGILTIADEIQTGIGRTGKMFACEHYDFVPDILLTAKSLAGGVPLSAVVGRADIMDSPGPGGLGGTFGGNPLALAAADAVLNLLEKDDLLMRAEAIGRRIEMRAKTWSSRFPLVGNIRRLGAMVGLELVRDRETREPAKKETSNIVAMAASEGVILIPAGTYGNVIRFLPPLVISDAELDEGLDVVERCVEVLNRTLVNVGAWSEAVT